MDLRGGFRRIYNGREYLCIYCIFIGILFFRVEKYVFRELRFYYFIINFSIYMSVGLLFGFNILLVLF